jgi:hypothetical protein
MHVWAAGGVRACVERSSAEPRHCHIREETYDVGLYTGHGCTATGQRALQTWAEDMNTREGVDEALDNA